MPVNTIEGRQRASVGNLEKINEIQGKLNELNKYNKNRRLEYLELKKSYEELYRAVNEEQSTVRKMGSFIKQIDSEIEENKKSIRRLEELTGNIKVLVDGRIENLNKLENELIEKIKQAEELLNNLSISEEMRADLEGDLIIYKAQLDTIRAENERIKAENEKAKSEVKRLDEVISEIGQEWEKDAENRDKAKAKVEEELNKFKNSGGSGRGLELSNTEIKNIIQLYLEGKTTTDICKQLRLDKGKVSRVLKGDYRGVKPKEQVLHIINHLRKINQNRTILEKLEELKAKYTTTTTT